MDSNQMSNIFTSAIKGVQRSHHVNNEELNGGNFNTNSNPNGNPNLNTNSYNNFKYPSHKNHHYKQTPNNRNTLNANNEIDFEMESSKLGESKEKEIIMKQINYNSNNYHNYGNNYIPSKLNAFPVSRHKSFTLSELKTPKKLNINIKNKYGNTITIEKSVASKLGNSSNFEWKHDLYQEIPKYKYLVFIRNIPRILTESKIREMFSEYGTIIGVNV